MKKKERLDEKKMLQIAAENKRMSEPLKIARADVKRLKKEKSEYEQDKQLCFVFVLQQDYGFKRHQHKQKWEQKKTWRISFLFFSYLSWNSRARRSNSCLSMAMLWSCSDFNCFVNCELVISISFWRFSNPLRSFLSCVSVTRWSSSNSFKFLSSSEKHNSRIYNARVYFFHALRGKQNILRSAHDF